MIQLLSPTLRCRVRRWPQAYQRKLNTVIRDAKNGKKASASLSSLTARNAALEKAVVALNAEVSALKKSAK